MSKSDSQDDQFNYTENLLNVVVYVSRAPAIQKGLKKIEINPSQYFPRFDTRWRGARSIEGKYHGA